MPGWAGFASVEVVFVLVLAGTAAGGALKDLPLSLPSKYCRLLFSKSGSFKYSSSAFVNPVGAWH